MQAVDHEPVPTRHSMEVTFNCFEHSFLLALCHSIRDSSNLELGYISILLALPLAIGLITANGAIIRKNVLKFGAETISLKLHW